LRRCIDQAQFSGIVLEMGVIGLRFDLDFCAFYKRGKQVSSMQETYNYLNRYGTYIVLNVYLIHLRIKHIQNLLVLLEL
jgi:hypothetical protein